MSFWAWYAIVSVVTVLFVVWLLLRPSSRGQYPKVVTKRSPYTDGTWYEAEVERFPGVRSHWSTGPTEKEAANKAWQSYLGDQNSLRRIAQREKQLPPERTTWRPDDLGVLHPGPQSKAEKK
jgi:hypothetical protein